MSLQSRPLTTPEAANHLGLSPVTLSCWRSRGGGPRYMKMGRSVRYRIEDLDTFMDQSARRHTSQATA